MQVIIAPNHRGLFKGQKKISHWHRTWHKYSINIFFFPPRITLEILAQFFEDDICSRMLVYVELSLEKIPKKVNTVSMK